MSNENTGIPEAVPPCPGGKRRAVRLRSARDARKLLGRLINEVRRDEIDAQKAARIGYLVGIFIKSVETDELEKRVVDLERKTGGGS
jgi:hypothetical protein